MDETVNFKQFKQTLSGCETKAMPNMGRAEDDVTLRGKEGESQWFTAEYSEDDIFLTAASVNASWLLYSQFRT